MNDAYERTRQGMDKAAADAGLDLDELAKSAGEVCRTPSEPWSEEDIEFLLEEEVSE